MNTRPTDAELLDRLAAHRTLGSAPREELAWLLAHGEFRHLNQNDVVTVTADGRLDSMYIMLSGQASIWVDRGAGKHKVLEWKAGDVMGRLPFSRMGASPGAIITEEAADVLVITEAEFPELIKVCQQVTATLVHIMLDRAREFTSSDLHDEKLVSLGKLAAGLAHELNNPASAVARSAKQLSTRVVDAELAARTLGAANLTDAQYRTLETTRDACLAMPTTTVRSPLQQADREDQITDWLVDHGADAGLAEQLSETAVTVDVLDDLAETLDGETLDAALKWIGTGCSMRMLALEIERSATRISDLVGAVKGFTYMDQATTALPVDVGEGLINTLAVLKSKARAKSVGITVNIEPDLPKIEGSGGELNQIWVNLIDNAIDAVAESGHIEVTAARVGSRVVICVLDDGPGVPEAIRNRIFDPFFTTKPLGQGTGLGLDITRRLVRRHDGDIELESSPGRTLFKVSLPITANNPSSVSP